MLRSWLATVSAVAILAAGAVQTAIAQNQGKPAATTRPAQAEALSEQEAYAIARDAYLYAYPIVLMDITMRQATNVPNANTVALRAPVNQFAHFRTYPKADARDVVRFNFDTLYSFAWLDLAKEPMVLSVPDTGDRYYLVPVLDMWSDVFTNIGTRTTGNKAGHYAIVAPGWTGTLPQGVVKVVAPTSTVWVMGRTQTNGPTDYANVHKVQDGYKLTPLGHWGKPYTPPANVPTDSKVDSKTEPQRQVDALDGMAMLTRVAGLLQKYPPHANDYPMLFRLRRLGLEAGKPFDAATLSPAAVATINRAAKDASADMLKARARIGRIVNGWTVVTENTGTYGTSYKLRAIVARGGLGANLPEDAIYPTALVDGDGQPLDGANRYVLHLDKGKTPPAGAFWSLTMYDNDGFQVPNPINRFAIGDRDKLKFNDDGSLDIHIQTESPGADKESNWLPAPKSGVMAPTLRIYAPKPEALDGTWAPPPLKRLP